MAQGSFVSNTTAKLEEVIVNGNPVPESALAQGSYSTPAIFAEVEAKAADNASVTILPTFNNIKKIIVESEDHNTRNVFEIRLGEAVSYTHLSIHCNTGNTADCIRNSSDVHYAER